MDAEGRAAEDAVMQHAGAALRSTVNTNLAYGAESPVGALKPTSAGFYDVMGNLWQVCADHTQVNAVKCGQCGQCMRNGACRVSLVTIVG